jgi:hypothetical protein
LVMHLKPVNPVRDALLHVLSIVRELYGAGESRRHDSAMLLTGIDVNTGGVVLRTESLKFDAYYRFGEYLRGGQASWDPGYMVDTIARSISRVLTVIIFDSILCLMGCVADKKGGTIKRARGYRLPAALDLNLEVGKRGGLSTTTWLHAAQMSMELSLLPIADFVVREWLKVEGWRNAEKYEEALKLLANLIAKALINDKLVRESSKRYSLANWHYMHYYHYTQRRPAGFSGFDWPLMVDKYAPHALCSYHSLDTLKGVELEDGGSAWRTTIDSQILTRCVEWLGERLENYSYSREIFKRYYEFMADVSGRVKGVASPIESIKALWEGWVGSLLPDHAEASREGDALHLLMRRPFTPLNMQLVVSSLAIHRQIAHTYTHVARLLSDEAKDAAEKTYATKKKRVYRDMSETLGSLYSPEGWEKYSASLDAIPERPAPSIYEQLFYAPTIVAGMIYNMFSSISLVLRLDPKIPPDPLDLLKRYPDLAELFSGPHFSKSIDLLRRSAKLPLGLLERSYLHIEDMLETPLLKGLVYL